MSVKYFPFDSLSIENPDRAADSSTLAEYLSSFFSNGVFPTKYNMLAVKEQKEGGLTVTVDSGVGIINGRIYIQDAPRTVSFEIGGTLDRIDRLVLRLDLNQQFRNIDIYALKGEEGLNPMPPALTRNNVVYEMSLATIKMPAGAKDIKDVQITDDRYSKELCGMVYVLLGEVDTSVISNQLQSYYETFVADTNAWEEQQRADMEAFVIEIKDILSGAVAAKLEMQIQGKMDKIATQQVHGELALKTDEGMEMALQGFDAKTTKFNPDGTITQKSTQGYETVTSFNADGSVQMDMFVAGQKKFTKKTLFNDDGSISEKIYAAGR